MTNTPEPRALAAALSAPAFVTKGGGLALHAANRHVSRWAPEVGEPGASRVQPLRNLGFVDRLVSPWIESAQRSASLRMFSNYMSNGASERPASAVSWLFPRPWYQDELDWMAAARVVGTQAAVGATAAPQMLTTRGTYVAPAQPRRESAVALPSALYEYVAPSLSIARPESNAGIDAYSPLVPLAATQAASVMSRAMAPLLMQSATAPASAATHAATRMSPGLRAVLSTMLERSAQVSYGTEASRVSGYAPELVTPPAPRAEETLARTEAAPDAASVQATQVAQQYATQRAHIVELQRVARVAAERELVARASEPARASRPASSEAEAVRDAQRVAETRLVEQQRAGTERTADAQRVDVAAQRARIEQRAADVQRATEQREQRVSELQRQYDAARLHASSRDAAARDARNAPTTAAPAATPAPTAVAPENRVAADIAAAVASLPPELVPMVASSIGNRPERAVQAIAELGEALRMAELIARNAAAGGSFESTRGPRLVMPAGLGGIVSVVERTTSHASSQAARAPSFASMIAPQTAASQPRASAARGITARAEMRMPSLPFLAAPGAPQPTSSSLPATSAIGAASAGTPAALQHVAWSDRWLARFAGANNASLDTLSVMTASPSMRLEMLAAAAPGTVFVAPFLDDARPAERTPNARPATIADALPTLRNAPAATPTVRLADDAETPDDMLFAIAAGAQSSRRPAPIASDVTATASRAVTDQPYSRVASTSMAAAYDRDTLADLVAHAAPTAPGAGLSAGLASSPFAGALRHLLTLGVAPTFDVRALFGGGIGATYLAGMLSASADEIATPAATLPSWATWTSAADAMAPSTSLGADVSAREVPALDLTYVAPVAGETPADSIGDVSTDVRAQTVATTAAAAQAAAEQVTTLRTALLSWNVDTVASAAGMPGTTTVSAPSVTAGPTSIARSYVDSMSLPMLGETAALGDLSGMDLGGTHMQASSYAAPGAIADRALGWSIAQERSTSDLSFDFVTPELLLAARVYGLGPTEAAQAARLAVAGPGQLTAMASAVDRMFVQAFAVDGERRDAARAMTAYPTASGDIAVAARAAASGSSAPATSPVSAATTASGDAGDAYAQAVLTPSRSAFGVERRMPRGAFLWPAATTAALGMNAAAPDGDMSMSVAALELLAAQAVAELGTYAAFGERPVIGADGAITFAPSVAGVAGGAPSAARGAGSDAIEADVLASAGAMLPQARREKFQALYLALAQSTSGATASPVARAARALALAGRGDESMTARERATIAWDVLPVVYGAAGPDGRVEESTLSTGDAAVRQLRRRDELLTLDPTYVDARPGLSGLSARAGEALGSYVSPVSAATATSSASASSSVSRARGGEQGALLRAPTAAQELVQTGRPAGRHGGGEVEIPAWFEEAARKMFSERSSVSSDISLADLTLVQTAAPQQVAASSRLDGGGSKSPTPALAGTMGAEKEHVDVEKLANEVYREIMVMMDVARERNGEPYL